MARLDCKNPRMRMDSVMRVARHALPLPGGLVLAAALLSSTPSLAQTARGEAAALEFKSDLPWTRLVLQEGNAKITGVAQLRVPGPLRGDYWLSASGRGVETQRGRVGIRLDEEGSRIVSQGPVPLRDRFLRSLFFPGFAQYGYREYGKATVMSMSAVATIIATGIAQDKVWDEEEEKDRAEEAVDEATNPTDRQRLVADYREALEEENLARARRNLYLFSTIGVWSVSLIDAVFYAPEFHVTTASDHSLSVAMQRKTRGAALVRAITFPGLGQQYNGQSLKGLMVATGGIACTVLFLHEQDDLLKARSQVTQFESRVELTPAGPERDSFEAQLARAEDEADGEERDRDLSLILLGTYWGVSILETMLSFDQPWGDSTVGSGWSFGMNATPEQAGVFASRAF